MYNKTLDIEEFYKYCYLLKIYLEELLNIDLSLNKDTKKTTNETKIKDMYYENSLGQLNIKLNKEYKKALDIINQVLEIKSIKGK